MAKSERTEKRQPWSTPELQRIVAGSAETVDNKGGDDGGTGSNDKS